MFTLTGTRIWEDAAGWRTAKWPLDDIQLKAAPRQMAPFLFDKMNLYRVEPPVELVSFQDLPFFSDEALK